MSLLWWISAKKGTSHTFTICLCFLRRMKWLHYSLLCRCHSPSVLASPSLVSVLHTAAALSSPEDVKFTVTSLFCSQWIPNCCRVIGGEAVKSSTLSSPPLVPIIFASPPRCPSMNLHLHGQMKANEGPLCFPVPNSFPLRIRLRLELCHDCQEQLGTQTEVALHWNHHYNLERPSMAERWEPAGPLCHCWPNSALYWLCWGQKDNGFREHVSNLGMSVGQKG